MINRGLRCPDFPSIFLFTQYIGEGHNDRSYCRDSPMKKFNVFEVYSLGKQLFPLSLLSSDDEKFVNVLWPLIQARDALYKQVGEESILLDASKRAAMRLIVEINDIVPTDIKEAFAVDNEKIVKSYYLSSVKRALENLETVLNNDMPGISTFFVVQKGIYRTEDLITHSENHFLEDIRKDIPEKAKEDIREAGKCLAFEIPTACAFHMWRAIETVMGLYYLKLTGKTFQDNGINRNWDSYIKALTGTGADKKITQFLDHIRKEYRNPQTHPSDTVSIAEAYGLFGAAFSSINQMILAIQKLPIVGAIPAIK